MRLRSIGATRRWHSTIAIAAAVSLFVALIAGSSLRPRFSPATLPEPAAWTHSQVQSHPAAQLMSHRDHGFLQSATPRIKKPFHSMWMTRDRPTSWTPLSPRCGWLALPSSSAESEPRPGIVSRVASAAAPVNRDMLTQLCVVRC
ncbi:hypothetical protein PJP10_10790 [Mycobacterium kansasii]